MPLNKKGKKIMRSMKEAYGDKAEEVFYASRNKGTIKDVENSSSTPVPFKKTQRKGNESPKKKTRNVRNRAPDKRTGQMRGRRRS